MQLPVKVTQTIGKIEFNYDQLKKDLSTQLKKFDNLVVIESELPEYKEVRANLNKVAKAIDDERKRIKKEYSEPLLLFENQTKELVSLITTVNDKIDSQIKGFEDKVKEDKLQAIKEYYSTYFDNRFAFELLFDDKWLNKTVTLKSAYEEIKTKHEKALSDLVILKKMGYNDTDWLCAIYVMFTLTSKLMTIYLSITLMNLNHT